MKNKVFSMLIILIALSNIASADIDCDGVDDEITTGVALSNFINADTLSLTAWLKVTGTPGGSASCYGSGPLIADMDGYVSMGRKVDTTFCGQIFGGGGHTVEATLASGWHHIAMTLGTGTARFYLDGVETENESSVDIDSLTANVSLCQLPGGAEGNSTDRITGVMTYDVALSAQEIYSLGKGRFQGPLRTLPTAYWPLGECADGTSGNAVSFKDRSGNNRNGTGDDGGNNTGLTCKASEYIKRRIGVW